jgi:hypothetical protein
MTLKEAILKSLEDINDITNYLSVYNYIAEKTTLTLVNQKHLVLQFQLLWVILSVAVMLE